MKEYRISEIFALMFGYMVTSVIIFILINNGLSLWLGFNVILALIPMLLITLVYKRMESVEFQFDWLSIILLIAFVFFFPNSLYVITDMIHINSSDFYEVIDYTTVYLQDFRSYVLLIHILLTVFIGTYAGIKSMMRFTDILGKKYSKSFTHICFFVLVFLSSIGIYIGRFLRFFSWDIFNPFKIVSELASEFNGFMVLFILLFTGVHYILYYGYRLLYEKEPF